MGEVFVQVRLANGGDVARARQGLATVDEVRYCDVTALVDTGSTRSAIPPKIVELLGLTVISQAIGKLADGSRAAVGVCGPVNFEIMGREMMGDAYVMGDEVLIGQITLEATDLLVDCAEQKLIPRHAEGPVFRL